MNIHNLNKVFKFDDEKGIPLCEIAFKDAQKYLSQVIEITKNKIDINKQSLTQFIDQEQIMVHGISWINTYVEALGQLLNWSKRLEENSNFGKLENLLLINSFAEYMCQLRGGIMMSQNELVRPSDYGLKAEEMFSSKNKELIELGTSMESKTRLVKLTMESRGLDIYGHSGLGEEYDLIRSQFKKFTEENVSPYAHEWHLEDKLVPESIISSLSELGVFGLTIPSQYGGLGMDKTSMCVVSEELSRGYIGVGSLGTRTEIAAELILTGGTEQQKLKWLPKLASGEVLPTAVFTEPNTGSDLGNLKTRAEFDGKNYRITGNKTWITHGARSDLMTLLARTDPSTDNYSGLSMFLAEKTRGDCSEPFKDKGILGGEIGVLGYRGMKEYEMAFDNFPVSRENLLGNVENQGFKQLMQTFESARIQTAARAVGVAQNALDLSISYANDRKQFGKSLIYFPRVVNKISIALCEIALSRQLTYYAAQRKDDGHRCDLVAGMAKLLSARVAWSTADNGVQIHGGNGFALEYPISRILCDSRILNIFEGAAEIQAQVIARRLLS